MLTAGYSDEPRLPQTDLVYVAFCVCYIGLLTELDTEAFIGTSDLDGGSWGFPTQMPFFQAVLPTVQLDLLATPVAERQIAGDQ